MSPALGNTAKSETRHYRSGEASSEIPSGSPVCFALDGVKDGSDVILPENGSSAAVAAQTVAGISLRNVPAGEIFEAAVSGYVNGLRLITGTRAASTDAYATTPAIALGDSLVLETVGNGLTRAGAAATGAVAQYVAMQTLASSATVASTTSDSSVVRTQTIKGFVRIL